MYHSYYFKIQALIGFVYGLGLLLFPKFMLNLHGLELSSDVVYFVTVTGGFCVGSAISAFLMRNAEVSTGRQAFLAGLFIQNLVVLICTTKALINEQINEWGWIIIALGIVLTTWCFFYVLVREDRMAFFAEYIDESG